MGQNCLFMCLSICKKNGSNLTWWFHMYPVPTLHVHGSLSKRHVGSASTQQNCLFMSLSICKKNGSNLTWWFKE